MRLKTGPYFSWFRLTDFESNERVHFCIVYAHRFVFATQRWVLPLINCTQAFCIKGHQNEAQNTFINDATIVASREGSSHWHAPGWTEQSCCSQGVWSPLLYHYSSCRTIQHHWILQRPPPYWSSPCYDLKLSSSWGRHWWKNGRLFPRINSVATADPWEDG